VVIADEWRSEETRDGRVAYSKPGTVHGENVDALDLSVTIPRRELAGVIETQPKFPPSEGGLPMVALEGTRTCINLEHAFTREGCFNRRILEQEPAAEAPGYRELAALSRTVAKSRAGFASGHLDFLVTDDDNIAPSGAPPPAFATRMTELIDDHTAMYAGMARTAHEEGFEEVASWFETLAKAGRSHVRRLRRILNECEIET
jgi:rubrerythrin